MSDLYVAFRVTSLKDINDDMECKVEIMEEEDKFFSSLLSEELFAVNLTGGAIVTEWTKGFSEYYLEKVEKLNSDNKLDFYINNLFKLLAYMTSTKEFVRVDADRMYDNVDLTFSKIDTLIYYLNQIKKGESVNIEIDQNIKKSYLTLNNLDYVIENSTVKEVICKLTEEDEDNIYNSSLSNGLFFYKTSDDYSYHKNLFRSICALFHSIKFEKTSLELYSSVSKEKVILELVHALNELKNTLVYLSNSASLKGDELYFFDELKVEQSLSFILDMSVSAKSFIKSNEEFHKKGLAWRNR